jgi:dephospho-CoA kinase
VLVVGLTGGIGVGKSTVAELLAARGASVVDVDELGWEVLQLGGRATEGVVARFGPVVVGPDGGIDRKALAVLVFRDPAALGDLTAISHPAINEALRERLRMARAAGAQVVVLDMAVLVESRLGYDAGGRRLYDAVVVVEAPWALRLARLVRRGMTAEEAVARRDAQAFDEERRAHADHIIVNDSDQAHLAAEVGRVWTSLVSRA